MSRKDYFIDVSICKKHKRDHLTLALSILGSPLSRPLTNQNANTCMFKSAVTYDESFDIDRGLAFIIQIAIWNTYVMTFNIWNKIKMMWNRSYVRLYNYSIQNQISSSCATWALLYYRFGCGSEWYSISSIALIIQYFHYHLKRAFL